jgi:hypothetical protein
VKIAILLSNNLMNLITNHPLLILSVLPLISADYTLYSLVQARTEAQRVVIGFKRLQFEGAKCLIQLN